MHAQPCLTLCNPMDCSSPGPSVHGIFQARILEWVAIFYSRYLPNPGIESASLASPALEADFFSLYHLGNPTLDPFINSSTVSFTHCGKTGVSLLPKLFPSWWIHLKSRWELNWGYVMGKIPGWALDLCSVGPEPPGLPVSLRSVSVRSACVGRKCSHRQEHLRRPAGGQAAARAHCCSAAAPRHQRCRDTPLHHSHQSLSPIFRMP